MHFFVLECSQLIITLIYCLLVPNPFAFLLCLCYGFVLSSAPLSRFKPSRTIMAVLFLISVFYQLSNRLYSGIISGESMQWANLYQTATIVLLVVNMLVRQQGTSIPVINKKIMVLVYLGLLCMVPAQKDWHFQLAGMAILIGMAWIVKRKDNLVNWYAVTLVKTILTVQLVLIYLSRCGYLSQSLPFVAQAHFQQVNIVCFLCCIVVGDLFTHRIVELPSKLINQIQMQQMRTLTEIRSSSESQLETSRALSQSLAGHQSKEVDTQPYNIVFLVPYFLLPSTIFQIPVYVYLFYLQYQKPPAWLRLSLYLALNIILVYQYSPSMKLVLVSGSMAFVMNWEINLESGLGGIKALWLRWCFVIVLILLFWFALKKVNIFHMVLTIILLLFVTRGTEDGERSFRNKNWKYLMLFFNVFLVVRYVYDISTIPDLELFQLLGISFDYNSQELISANFNFVPLLMWIAISLQYWTYGSQTYKKESKKVVGNFLKNYKLLLKKVVTVITIMYYKFLVSFAYIVTLFLILIETFSVSSGAILTWTLLIFLCEYSRRDKSMLYRMWKILSVLLSVMIVVRYFFEFTKFPTIYKLFSTIPMFSFLYRHQLLLGLSVDNSAQNYFHTITKFQLMIALDFVQLLLTYLVVDYYAVILKYNNRDQLDPVQRQKVQDVYRKYIAFKLQDITRTVTKIIREVSIAYIKIFYLMVCLYSALYPSLCQLPFILVSLVHFYRLNDILYRMVASSKILARVRDKFRLWIDYHSGLRESYSQQIQQIKAVNTQLQSINAQLMSRRIQLHGNIRPYLILTLVCTIILLYTSRLLYGGKLKDFVDEESLFWLRWYFYIYGTSVARTEAYNGMPMYILLMVMIILEAKACQFVSSFTLTETKHPLKIPVNNSSQQVTEKSMRVNILLGLQKLAERSYVTVLIFTSSLKSTPASLLYLVMAFVLNTFGTSSLLILSKIQIMVTCAEYCSMILNFENEFIYPNIPDVFKGVAHDQNLFSSLSADWQNYWTFGKNKSEMAMFIIGTLVIASYQLYFRTMLWTAARIISILSKRILNLVNNRLFSVFRSLYSYTLVLSPLNIALVSIAIYIVDNTLTNLLLFTTTGVFVLKEYICQELSNTERTRTFWKVYLRLFQVVILAVMVLECILAIPQYQKYCVPLLCYEEQNIFNKLLKCFLVLIFQLGIDILKSKQFQQEMTRFIKNFYKRAQVLRLVVANHQNDLRLEVLKTHYNKRKTLKQNLKRLLNFLELLKLDKQLKYEDRNHISPPKETLIDVCLQYMPTFLDPMLILDTTTAVKYLGQQNRMLISLFKIPSKKYCELDDCYDREFTFKYPDVDDLIQKIDQRRIQFFLTEEQYEHSQQQLQLNTHVDLMPNYSLLLEENIRQTIIQIQQPPAQVLDQVEYEEKKKMLKYMVGEVVVSNWQYITYLFMILEHLHNNSVLTFFYPVTVFLFGMIQHYQADRIVWAVSFGYTLAFSLLKYLVSLEIVILDQHLSAVLIGARQGDFLTEFFLLIAIPVQTLLLQSIGLYRQSIYQIQSMKTCLVRNLLKVPRDEEGWKQELETLLKQQDNTQQSESVIESIFGRSQLKTGYDYSFLITTVQLFCLIYSFLFYQRMFIVNDLSFYSMIQYNQFNGGMVVWMLLQMLLMLFDRFLSILSLRNSTWQITLVLKHGVLIVSLCLVNYMLLFQTQDQGNNYTYVFGAIYSLYFLMSALQVRNGIDKISRGFMERYTWYNGFIYMGFRAVPFVFEFKVFSDWFVTRTVMRLFDWIKFEDLFGRLFVAKCNALFLQGKVMGTKIQWWKKVLMGLPLLAVIIVLLFGPLVLFSTLNPLSQANPIIGGSVYISLSINSSNVYPLYVNSHISKIHIPQMQDLSPSLLDVIQDYNIEKQCIQKVKLEAYSDSYWQISEGSQQKLLQEPRQSRYELIMTAKFVRNFTSSTPVYTLATYTIPIQRIDNFKETLAGKKPFKIQSMYDNTLRLDNNNGLHVLTASATDITMYAQLGTRRDKKYWMISNGLEFVIVSDKYSKAIFGYSVMGFYISIILVVANYFRFIFHGSANTIWLTDIPVADPILTICQAIYLSRVEKDLIQQDFLYWALIDLVRSPDTVKLLTGNYLDARKQTIARQEIQQGYEYEVLSPPPRPQKQLVALPASYHDFNSLNSVIPKLRRSSIQ